MFDLVSRTEDFQTLADIFALLSDMNRIRIYWMLCHSEECVQGIATMMEMSSPAVSHHLKKLQDAGLVVNRRIGKEVYYRAADNSTARNLHEAIESLMETACPQSEDYILQEEINADSQLHKDQQEIITEIHRYMVNHLSERITIETLSKKFHINTTTLKVSFKKLYGSSIAAHMKEHRMKKAAELIEENELNFNEISKAVGYDSQSKFTAAFREHFGCTPTEYRKKL